MAENSTHLMLTISIRYDTMKPQSYRVGDIVEVQLSFVVVPLRNQKYKLVNVLHSIALLEGRFSQVLKFPIV